MKYLAISLITCFYMSCGSSDSSDADVQGPLLPSIAEPNSTQTGDAVPGTKGEEVSQNCQPSAGIDPVIADSNNDYKCEKVDS